MWNARNHGWCDKLRNPIEPIRVNPPTDAPRAPFFRAIDSPLRCLDNASVTAVKLSGGPPCQVCRSGIYLRASSLALNVV